MDAAEKRVTALINENPVMVFSKSYCPFCDATKNLLNDLDAQCKIVELDRDGQYLFSMQPMDAPFDLRLFLFYFALNRYIFDQILMWIVNRRRRNPSPESPQRRKIRRPADRAQHLYPTRAHRWQFRPPSVEGTRPGKAPQGRWCTPPGLINAAKDEP